MQEWVIKPTNNVVGAVQSYYSGSDSYPTVSGRTKTRKTLEFLASLFLTPHRPRTALTVDNELLAEQSMRRGHHSRRQPRQQRQIVDCESALLGCLSAVCVFFLFLLCLCSHSTSPCGPQYLSYSTFVPSEVSSLPKSLAREWWGWWEGCSS